MKRHGQAASSGSKTKAPGSAAGYLPSWRDACRRICRNRVVPMIDKHSLALYSVPDFSDLLMKLYKGPSIESSRGLRL
jgi:hypothetical protein